MIYLIKKFVVNLHSVIIIINRFTHFKNNYFRIDFLRINFILYIKKIIKIKTQKIILFTIYWFMN